MMEINDEQTQSEDVPQLRAYWGDEQEVIDRRHVSDSMRRAQRAWARIEVYRANLYPSGRLSALIVG
jgi:hypothetical protein